MFSVSDVAEWIGDEWRDLGPAALGLDPSDLERINLDSLEEMLDEFGTFNFSKSQANALIEAAKKAWDESGKFDFVCFLCFFNRFKDFANRYITCKKVRLFNFGTLFIRHIGVRLGVRDPKASLWYCPRQNSVFICLIDTGKWSGEKLRQLGSLVKGLDTTDIKKLGKEAFEEAVGVWGKYLDVDKETLEALAEKAKEVRPNRN